RIGNDEIEIKANGVSKALASWTRTVWVIETEKPWLGSGVDGVVVLAFEAFRKPQSFRVGFGRFDERGSVTFLEADLQRINQALTNVRTCSQTIDQHKHVFKIVARVIVR